MSAELFEGIAALKDEQNVVLPRSSTALLVVDMQKYFVEPDSPFARTWKAVVPGDYYHVRLTDTVIPNIQALLSAARLAPIPVLFTAMGSQRENGEDLMPWAKTHNAMSERMVGAPMYPPISDRSSELHESVAPAEGERVIQKCSSGPSSTELIEILRSEGIDAVVTVGVATDVCVTQNARELADRGLRVVIAEDACAALTENAHMGALLTFAGVFGRVTSTARVLDAMQGGTNRTA